MFEGTYTALITPFLDTPAGHPDIDYETWEALIEWQLGAGVSGLVVYGTTGESPTLSVPEKLELLKRAIAVVKGRVPVIAGTGSNNTKASIELTKEAAAVGADAVLAVAPYYNKPTQEGLYLHFKALAEQGGLPVVVYNVPGRTCVKIEVDTLARLAVLPNIAAIKQAVDSAGELVDLGGRTSGELSLMAGDDPIIYSTMCAGGTGVISATASAFPEKIVAITEAALRGDWQASRTAQQEALPYISAIFTETNPIPAKAALALMSRLPHETLRLPLVPAADATRSRLKELLVK